MIQDAFDILSLSNEAALCTRGALICYANAAARALLGEQCVGQSLRELFGEELSGMQSSSFIADFPLGSRRCTARFTRMEKGYLIYLTPDGQDPAVMNEPMLFSLRSTLMNMGVVTDGMRERGEARQDAALLGSVRSLTQCYCRLTRQIENAGFVLGLLRGSIALQTVPVDLRGICLSAAEAVAAFFPDVEIETVMECEGMANASPAHIKLMLLNLLENCLMHAACRHIRLRLSETQQSFMFSISDDGRGIPAEELNLAFDRYRYAFDAQHISGGPGLGLSVARGAAQLHDGTLLLESRPGQGTAVRVTISRNLRASSGLFERGDSLCSSRDLLVGLADCLPPEAFSEKYLD